MAMVNACPHCDWRFDPTNALTPSHWHPDPGEECKGAGKPPKLVPATAEATLKMFKRMVRNLGRLIPANDHWDRVSGGAICTRCGLEMIEHPVCGGDHQLHIRCDGKLVKL